MLRAKSGKCHGCIHTFFVGGPAEGAEGRFLIEGVEACGLFLVGVKAHAMFHVVGTTFTGMNQSETNYK